MMTYHATIGDDGARLIPVIRLPNGRQVTIPTYCAAFRRVRSADPNQWINPRDWDGFGCRADRLLRQMRDGMAERINRHMAGFGVGRKWSAEWQRGAREVAYRLPRRIITRERECPKELRARLAHRLYQDGEF